MSLFDSASLVITPNGTKASKLYSIKPTDGSGDLSVTRATTATRVNSSGLIESVSANVPRLDYTNSSCPSILVEPQRTNTILQSENLATSWTSFRSVVTTNVTTSPSGLSNADKIAQETGNVDAGGVYQTISISNGTTYTYSFYAKAAGYNWTFARIIDGGTNYYVWFNLATGVVGTIQGSATATISNVGNGWYRCSVTFTSTGTGNQVVNYVANADNSDQIPSPDSVKGIYIWGSQLEAGSYATSYIPTTSASVTRNADVISKTGISSLIGQTDGTLFVDFYVDDLASQTNDPVVLSFNSSNYIEIFRNGRVNYYDGSGNIDINLPSYGLTNGRHKFAIAYNTNDVVFYIDGSLAGTDTSCTPSAKSNLYLTYINSNFYGMFKYNGIALWKTRLTNSELATLTTI